MFVFKKILSGRVFLLLLLLLLYLNFFIEGAVTVVHVVIIVTLLLLAWKILKSRHCEFICYLFWSLAFSVIFYPIEIFRYIILLFFCLEVSLPCTRLLIEVCVFV